MLKKQTVCLRQLGGGRAQEVKFGRWMSNDQVTQEEIISRGAERTSGLVSGRHVLAIQDTTELNYQAHAGRVSGLGTVGNGSDKGLFLHPLLAVDAADGTCLGLAHIHTWLRVEPSSVHHSQRLIEDKESYRWLEVAEAGKRCLSRADKVTIVADRESDIYDEWVRIPDERTHLLTRVCRDRSMATGGMLYSWVSAQPVRGTYCFEVPSRQGKRTAHKATLEVRFGAVTIKKPQSCRDKQAPRTVSLYVIEVKEVAQSVVGKEKPIHWRLLTTHRIESLEDALQCVAWYRWRWHIEQLFRTLKKQGLDIESSQLETGEALLKLACVAVQVAMRTMQLVLAREGNNAAKVSDLFEPAEVFVLEKILPTLEGKTTKQKNPHSTETLAYAAWIIARLGGWKGYASEAKPGPITMLRGLQEFEAICYGWKLAHEKMCA